jgi:hypothetical protein
MKWTVLEEFDRLSRKPPKNQSRGWRHAAASLKGRAISKQRKAKAAAAARATNGDNQRPNI